MDDIKEFGRDNKEVIMLLHGGGLSWWNYREEAQLLQSRYHVVIPILDGHAGSGRKFSSIENNARELLDYIDDNFHGRILALCGLSLGGQIAVEMLSQRSDICRFAVIESALTKPMPVLSRLMPFSVNAGYPLMSKPWFSKLQFKALHIKDGLFDDYYRDSCGISKPDMIAFLKANSSYRIKKSLCGCTAKTLILAGGKEQRKMKLSARMLDQTIIDSRLEILRGYTHGDISLNHARLYVDKLLSLLG